MLVWHIQYWTTTNSAAAADDVGDVPCVKCEQLYIHLHTASLSGLAFIHTSICVDECARCLCVRAGWLHVWVFVRWNRCCESVGEMSWANKIEEKEKKKHGDLRRIEFYPKRMGVNDTSIVSNGICAIERPTKQKNKSETISIVQNSTNLFHVLAFIVLIFQVICVQETAPDEIVHSLNMLRNILRMAKMCVRGNTTIASNTTAKHSLTLWHSHTHAQSPCKLIA